MKDFKWEPKYTVIAVYTFLVAAALLLFGTFLYNFKSFWSFVSTIVRYLVPFIYGFGLAFILSPLLRLYERWMPRQKLSSRLRRTLCILLTYLTALALLVLFLGVVIPTMANSISSMIKSIPLYSTQLDVMITELLALIPMEFLPPEFVTALDNMITGIATFVLNLLSNVLPHAIAVTTQVTSGVIDTIMGIIISIYMLSNKELLFAQCKKLLYAVLPAKFVARLIDVAHDSNVKFSGFLIGKIIDSIIIGILCAIGMSIFKMPFVTLVSLIIGVTNFIPYFGPFIGAIPGIILVFIGGGWAPALGFAIFVLVLQQFDGNILGPAILGQSTGLDAMWVIFAILLFGGLYGFVGMIIGVPLLSVIFGLCKEFMHRQLQRKGMSSEITDYASEKHPLITGKKKD